MQALAKNNSIVTNYFRPRFCCFLLLLKICLQFCAKAGIECWIRIRHHFETCWIGSFYLPVSKVLLFNKGQLDRFIIWYRRINVCRTYHLVKMRTDFESFLDQMVSIGGIMILCFLLGADDGGIRACATGELGAILTSDRCRRCQFGGIE